MHKLTSNVFILGGGGNRLTFELALLKDILRDKVPNLIIGSSAGAVAGAIAAQAIDDNSLDIFDDILENVMPGLTPFNANRKFRALLPEYVKALPITPVVLQVTDLSTGYRRGICSEDCDTLEDYHNLIIASASVPLFFGVQQVNLHDGRTFSHLGDGGVWDSVPVHTALSHIDEEDDVTVISTQFDPMVRFPRTRLGWQLRMVRLRNLMRSEDDLAHLPGDYSHYSPLSLLPPKWWGGPRITRRLIQAAEAAYLYPDA